ncbi:hypothetical protein ACFX19_000870 [Malus domestica]
MPKPEPSAALSSSISTSLPWCSSPSPSSYTPITLTKLIPRKLQALLKGLWVLAQGTGGSCAWVLGRMRAGSIGFFWVLVWGSEEEAGSNVDVPRFVCFWGGKRRVKEWDEWSRRVGRGGDVGTCGIWIWGGSGFGLGEDRGGEEGPISNKKTPNFPETLTLPRPGSSHSNPSAPIDQDEMKGAGFSNLDDNLIFEVFKHMDAQTLGMASCPAAKICGPHSWRVPAASRPLHLASQQGLLIFQLRPFFLVGGVLLYFALGDSSGEADVELEAVERSVGKGRGEFVALAFLDSVLQEDELRLDRMGVNRKRTEE